MSTRINGSSVIGVKAHVIEVEVHLSGGLPSFTIVGLPDAACRESQARVRSAVYQSGFKFPPQRITVNLAPADIRKEGTGFDLPIAVAVLLASGQIEPKRLLKGIFCGELALDGRVRSVPGLLPRAIASKERGQSLVIPSESKSEVERVEGAEIYGVQSLKEVIELMEGEEPDKHVISSSEQKLNPNASYPNDFSEVKGQLVAKRGIEIAVSGGHNLLLIGPPGAGKTMLAKRIPTILPEMNSRESLETAAIHSIAGILSDRTALDRRRPFREPHHTISDVALIGGGSHPKPGEISLSHNGVLFMDEFPEFKRNVIEVLRQPIEEGRVVVSRAAQTLEFPARFNLVAAMNPCPCGYLSDEKQPCTCTPRQIRSYLSKLSGPLLDRIDIHIEVSALSRSDYLTNRPSEASSEIRTRVVKARKLQQRRYEGLPFNSNALLHGKWMEKFCRASDEAERFMTSHLEKMGFSARAYYKVMKVARTIADIDGAEQIQVSHVQEAIQFRCLDRISRLQMC